MGITKTKVGLFLQFGKVYVGFWDYYIQVSYSISLPSWGGSGRGYSWGRWEEAMD